MSTQPSETFTSRLSTSRSPFRAGIIQWINQQEDLACFGEAGSVRAAREAVKRLQPDIILLDLRLGAGDGLDLIAELAGTHPDVRILALSQFDEVVYARRALQAGARRVALGTRALQPEFMREALAEFGERLVVGLDVRGQLAALSSGRARILELVQAWGAQTVKAVVGVPKSSSCR